MCAHYNSITRGPDIGRWGLEWANPDLSDLPRALYPRYRGAVIRRREGALGMDVMTWGLIPSWAKQLDYKKFKYNFNARAETVDTLPSFRTAFRHRRCLVPAECFVEHPAIDGEKIAHRVSAADGEPLMFAGLWEHWSAGDGSEELYTYTILTTEPHEGLRWLHHRMPVALTPEEAEEWLDPNTTPERAKELLRSPTPESLEIVPL